MAFEARCSTRLLLTLVCALVTAACGGSKSGGVPDIDESVPVALGGPGPGDATGHFPMELGNLWQFEGKVADRHTSRQFRTWISTVGTRAVVAGATATVFAETNGRGDVLNESVVVADSAGLAEFADVGVAGQLGYGPYWALRFPLEPGASFVQVDRSQVPIGEDLDGDGRSELLAVRSVVTVTGVEDVTVPAGTFTGCAAVETSLELLLTGSAGYQRAATTLVRRVWYAPGIGSVRIVEERIVNRTVLETAQLELSAYVVNGTAAGIIQPDPPMELALATRDLVYDPLRRRFYASRPNTLRESDTVAIIDPATATVTSVLNSGDVPAALALSDDSRFLYVGRRNSIARVDLAAPGGPAVDLTIPLGKSPETWLGEDYAPQHIAVAPGRPRTIAVARTRYGEVHGGVAVYDDAERRPLTTPEGPTQPVDIDVVAFGTDASTLYGLEDDEEPAFYRMSVAEPGVALAGAALRPGAVGTGRGVAHVGGVAVFSNGVAIDAATGAVLGTCPVPQMWRTCVEVDASRGIAFFAGGTEQGIELHACDLAGFVPLGGWTVPGVLATPRELVRFGERGLAIREDHRIVFTWAPLGLF